ncbi:MAG: 6-phospho-beta-galactosidase [Mycoplasmoidaceae bacterium]
MIIALGCDHIVTPIKNNVKLHLEALGHTVIDCGTYNDIRTHYPIYGMKVASLVVQKEAQLGIVICGTGVGISNSANKIKGARCVLTSRVTTAIQARKDLDANVLACGGRIVGEGLLLEIIDAFISTKYAGKNDQKIKDINDIVKYENFDLRILDEEIRKWEKGYYTDGENQTPVPMPIFDLEKISCCKPLSKPKLSFPKNFIFGAATAAYQIEGAVNEGGRGPCIWDAWYHRPGSTFNADVACDFYHLYEKDLQLGSEIGMNGIRISIAWSRIFPHNNEDLNQEGLKYYHDVIDTCIANGVEPFITLHHFDSPQWVVDQGDWFNKQTIKDFEKYADVCFKEFGSKIRKWASFNEPFVYNADKYIYGESPPNEVGDVGKTMQALHNMMVAHAKVVLSYKQKGLPYKIGIVHVMQPKYPFDPNDEKDCLAAKRATVLYNQFMLDANLMGGYLFDTIAVVHDIMNDLQFNLDITNEELLIFNAAKNKTDFIGINYYNPSWFKWHDGETIIIHNGTGEKGKSKFQLKGLGEVKTPDHIETTEWDWPIYPQGIRDIMVWIADRYPNYQEFFVSENGIGWKETLDHNQKVFDDYRIEYCHNHLEQCLLAIHEDQINLNGYYLWSWQDMFSWTNGFNKRYGLFFVDFKTQDRYKKLSSKWYENVIKSNSLDLDLDLITKEYANEQSKKY